MSQTTKTSARTLLTAMNGAQIAASRVLLASMEEAQIAASRNSEPYAVFVFNDDDEHVVMRAREARRRERADEGHAVAVCSPNFRRQ